jgi:methylmalonyl-CoA mutase
MGHDRSVDEVVNTIFGCNAIALTSSRRNLVIIYDLLVEKGAGHIKIFGGGGGVILPYEIEELQAYGVIVFTH